MERVSSEEITWMNGFDFLRKYAESKGHTSVPANYVTKDGYGLGHWAQNQRRFYKRGKLSAERQKVLEQLPGWVWNVKIYKWNAKTDKVIQPTLNKWSSKWNKGFQYLQKYAQLTGHTRIPIQYVTSDGYNLGTWVATQRMAYQKGKLSTERKRLLKHLPRWVWSIQKIKIRQLDSSKCDIKRLDSSKWDNGFKHLQEYARITGHTRVPSQYVTSDGYNLGTWVAAKRTAYRKGKLLREQKKMLGELPKWVWDNRKPKISWSKGLKHLLKYLKIEGHMLVPLKHVTKNGFKLGWWVSQQRQFYKQGKLLDKQQQILEQLPGWAWDTHEVIWAKSFEYLRKYVESEGHANVPRGYVGKDGYKLGLWVMWNRERYRQGGLSKKRKLALEQLPGWVWNPRKSGKQVWTQAWTKSFEHLRKYVESEGHAAVPATYVTDNGYKLGTWVRDQRHKYNKGQLSKEKQKALEQLPGWIWALERSGATWSDALTYLHEYVNREGHASVPFKYIMKDGYNLGTWVRDQRHKYNKGQLSKEKQKALEQLPGWMWTIRKRGTWTKGFECLRKYIESGGYTFVPQRYTTEDGFKLGWWVSQQRQFYKQRKLSAERQKTLEELPGWMWDSLEQKWLESFKHLRKYTVSKGNTYVPLNYVAKDGYKLGKWVSNQRQLYKQRKLSTERQKALEQLRGWTWVIRKRGTWTKSFEYLRKYVESKGHVSVPTAYVTDDGYKLGSWVTNQRQLYKRGKLSVEKQKALDQLPGWKWNTKKTAIK